MYMRNNKPNFKVITPIFRKEIIMPYSAEQVNSYFFYLYLS